jgi:hypothetical protein
MVVPVRQKRHDQEPALEPMAAFAGALAAAGEAGRYAGGGMRTVGRRFAGTRFSRRAGASARESRRRATLAYRVLRGLEPAAPPPPAARRPADYMLLGFAVGTTGAAVAGAVRRAMANIDSRSLTAQVRGVASAVRGSGTPAASDAAREGADTQPVGTAPGGSGTTP